MTANQDALPPGPYRFEMCETADTYRIFAADSDKPIVEMIYIGGGNDFAATAGALAQLFAASSNLFASLSRSEFLMFRASRGDHKAFAKLADAARQAGETLIEAVGVEEEETPEEVRQIQAMKAAPKLLEALIAVKDAGYLDGGYQPTLDMVDAAIASATRQEG